MSQLQRLDEIVAERNRQLLRYRDLLDDLPVKLLKVPDNVVSSVHLAVIRLQQTTAEHHRQLFEALRSAGIGVQVHYIPVHLQPHYRKRGFREGAFPKPRPMPVMRSVCLCIQGFQFAISNELLELLLHSFRHDSPNATLSWHGSVRCALRDHQSSWASA